MIEQIDIRLIEPNEGQIIGVPKNPRFIRDARFKALKKSIEDAPEFMQYNPVLLFPYLGKFVAIGGNMRLRVCKELKWKTISAIVLPANLEAKKLREYVHKHNIQFGDDDWDLLASEWKESELKEWGKELDWLDEPSEKTQSNIKTDENGEKFILEVECPDDVELDLLFAELTNRDYICTRRR